MALPEVNTPIYELTVPSSKEDISFRPFLVGEEKILLIAQESNSPKDMLNAVKKIVNRCTFDKFDVDNCPLYDLEYVFVKLRAKSVGEMQKINVRIDDKDARDKYAEVEINLEEVEVVFSEIDNSRIEVTDQIGFVMKHPKIDLALKSTANTNAESFFKIIEGCVDFIYDGDDVFYPKDLARGELALWIEKLSDPIFRKIEEFFENMPELKKEVKFQYWTMETKGEDDEVIPGELREGKQTLSGLSDFFT
jgi:hypothetical protein